MKSIAALERLDNSPSLVASRLSKLCRSLVVRQLKKIKVGSIVLKEGDHEWVFGDVNHPLSITITVDDINAYKRVLFSGTIGAGESYMLGLWQVSSLVDLIRLMLLNRSAMQNMESNFSAVSKMLLSLLELTKINSLRGSKRNICAHYDLSNDFFSLFLDPLMMYSSAIYTEEANTLDLAAEFKLKHICERLDLKASDHLVEIGSGWGSLAIYAASHYGCRVTTTTISDEQFEYAKQRIEDAGLQNKITLLNQDYRNLEGAFDKLVSVEMIEAVGHQYYHQFFEKCSTLLKPDGLALIQAITISDDRYETERNKTDFIRRYIFPGGCLPSNNIIAQMLTRFTDMQSVGFEDITFHYAETLKGWRLRFLSALPEVRALGFDDVFIRMWEFYLAYCEGGFRERSIHTGQFLFAKPDARCLPAVG